MEERWDEVYNFLSHGIYPPGLNKSQKLNLRRYSEKFVVDDGEIFVGKRRAIKSKEEARRIFEEFHRSPMGGHSGILKTRSAVSSRYYWKGMSIDVDKWVVECAKCQKVGKHLPTPQPIQHIKVSDVWELVGIDITGPFPKTTNGFEYILTATDYFSKWVEAFPLQTITAQEIGPHICSIIYRHGCPKRIVSDHGTEFVNDLNTNLCQLLGIERSITAAQTNGLDEKTNQNIKRELSMLVNERQDNWDIHLEATLFSLRSKVNTATKFTPFMLMYGREAALPSEVPIDMPLSSISLPDETTRSMVVDEKLKIMENVKEKAADTVSISQDYQKQASARRALKKCKNRVGDEVLLFNMKKRGRKGEIKPEFTGPYIVTSIAGKLVSFSNSDGITVKTVLKA